MDGSAVDVVWGSCGTGSPAGSNHDVQINSSGAFGAITTPTDSQTYSLHGTTGADPTWALEGVVPNAQTGTSYTFLTGDRLKYVSFSNASAIAVTLPQAGSTGFTNNWAVTTKNLGAGLVTITPTTSTINGAATLTMAQGRSCRIFSDNTNYFAVCDMGNAQLIRVCEVVTGDPGSASVALADDNDSPNVCSNDSGVTMTITAVHCYADAGSPTVTPIITGGSSTSILSSALTCSQTQGGAAGTLNGTPTQTAGQTIDANITTAGGTAKYIVVRITRTL
jgi:hypothetical protein